MTGSLAGALVRAYGLSDVGLVRSSNEDAFVIAPLDGEPWASGGPSAVLDTSAGALLAVSDGMGGAKAGEVASALTVEAVLEGMKSAAREKKADGETLRKVVEGASAKVHEEGKRPDRRGMGATLTAVLVSGSTAFIAQIGDSRAYLLRAGKIGQVTHDQSYVQMLVDAGVMTPEEAERSPRRNIIMQVMGQEEVRVVLGKIEMRKGDRLLICSDGLTNVLDDTMLATIAKPPADIASAARELVSSTRKGGAPDNVTVIVAEIV